MNARAVVLMIGCLLCGLAAAPAAAEVSWEGGLRGGLGLGKMRGDTRISDSQSDGVTTVTVTGDISGWRTGFAGGTFVGARLSDAFALRLEILYAQKGGDGPVDVFVDGTPAGTATLAFKLDYVEFPLLAVWSVPAGTRATLDVFGGPALGFKSAAKLRIDVMGISEEADIKDTVKGTDVGLSFGAGVRILASETVNLLLDGRFTLGLSDFPEGTGAPSLKNDALAFTAGLSFPLSTPRARR